MSRAQNGEMVIFIHEDTTPAPILGSVARDLVKKAAG